MRQLRADISRKDLKKCHFLDNQKRMQTETPVKIYVNNLPLDMDEKAITKYFSQYGTIINTFLMVDEAQTFKGMAFITFQKRSDAKYCIKDLNNANFEGKHLVVREAKNQTNTVKDPNRKKEKSAPFQICPNIMQTPEIVQYTAMLNQLKETILKATENATNQ